VIAWCFRRSLRKSVKDRRKTPDSRKMAGTVSVEAQRLTASAASVESREVQALLVVLSVTAGCTDIISFLGLNGLFAAHITGNLVILAAHFFSGESQIAPMLSVPVFIVIVSLTRVLAPSLESRGWASLQPLLLLQVLLLAGFLVLCIAAGPRIDPKGIVEIIAGMLGVSAMAVQNALVKISLEGAPSTAAMTSNVTLFAMSVGMSVGEMLVGGDPAEIAEARKRAARALPAILGFAVGCGLGATYESAIGLRSLALPVGLALLAFFIGFAAPNARRR
jgi:uncharacterized membrane protein YoaK (UPF0700 family)